MNEAPLVSIRCLVYNHEPYLRQCLDGFVMQQTTFPFEAIVHDDASTDGSAAIIREYAEKYPDIIKPIYETENQYSKHDGSLTRIMDAAMHPNSKYVALCEGDDYWTDPHKLQMQADVLENNPDCTIVFSRVQIVNKKGTELNKSIPAHPELFTEGIITLDDYMLSEFYYGYWTFHTSTFFYRRSCMELHNKLSKTLYVHYPYNDQPLLLSCLFQGKGYYLSNITGRYRWLSGGFNSMIRKNPQTEIDSYENRIKAWKDIDVYTKGKYSKYISRNCNRFKCSSLLLQYNNGMMNFAQKMWFIFYKFWTLRIGEKSLRYIMIEFLDRFFPRTLVFCYKTKRLICRG